MPHSSDDLGASRDHWQRFARESPLGRARQGSREDDPAAFYASGEADVAGILEFVGRDVARRRALDLGCGPGRLLNHLALEFEHVDGVDISDEMIRVARSSGLAANVDVATISGAVLESFPDATFDLVISLLVLQHVPSDKILGRLIGDVARVLAADGRAFVQFDTRPLGPARRTARRLPDVLLPSARRRHFRRHSRSPQSVDRLIAKAGLSVLRERGSGSADHHLVVGRASRPDGERRG